ncbi:MAG: endolytic transglycosylase MltG [Oscillospiraceae bacterium]|nr:endolytic transglycosylase MltG [Oscillospiraceae bacterium]MCL2278054.1 endolytic transglycosylase MltG [Oscillospiraceae bacterium]
MSGERDKINSLEDALRAVDESGLAPPPIEDRALPRRNNSRSISTRSVSDVKVPGARKTKFTSGLFAKSKADKVTREEEPVDAPVRINGDDGDLDIGPDDFKVKFDFESAYRDVPENKPLRLRRERRTGLVGGLLLATFVICVSLILASIAWVFTMDVLGFGSVDEAVNVTIPADFSIENVAEILYEAGVIRHRNVFLLYAEFSDAKDRIVPGSFVLNRNFDYRAIVQGMTPRAGVRVETTVTIPEGFTLAQIFELLEREEVTPAADLWEAATNHHFDFHFLDRGTLGDRHRLEGFLFPETYNFFKGSTPVQTISRMLREFNRRFSEEYVERAYELGFTIHEIITIAAMIEREAGDDAERPRIAAVIYNRLENPNFPFLQIDATIFYAIAGTGIPFSTRVDSPFNTYTHEGLPPGPIANPGLSSIRAALFPASTNEYFYALNNYGTHNFFTNYNDHRNFVNSPDFGG